MSNKFKSPLFWLSLLSIVLAAAGIDFESMTSWRLLLTALLDILRNPVALVTCCIAVMGVWNDNGTKGLDGFK